MSATKAAWGLPNYSSLSKFSVFLLQSTVCKCGVDERGVLRHLLLVKDIRHIGEVLLYSLVHLLCLLVGRSLGSVEHVCAEHLVHIFHGIHLVEGQSECGTQTADAHMHVVSVCLVERLSVTVSGK